MHGGLPPERRALEHLHLDAVALLDLAPDGVRLGEEDVRVEREHAGARLAGEQHVEQHCLFLLERAGECEPRVETVDREVDDLLGAQRLDVGLSDEHGHVPLRHGRSKPTTVL